MTLSTLQFLLCGIAYFFMLVCASAIVNYLFAEKIDALFERRWMAKCQ